MVKRIYFSLSRIKRCFTAVSDIPKRSENVKSAIADISKSHRKLQKNTFLCIFLQSAGQTKLSILLSVNIVMYSLNQEIIKALQELQNSPYERSFTFYLITLKCLKNNLDILLSFFFFYIYQRRVFLRLQQLEFRLSFRRKDHGSR